MAKKFRTQMMRALGRHVLAANPPQDAREGSRFDAAGFANFFPEENKRCPDAVAEAWIIYEYSK